jgi:hypothetical protein
MPEHDLRHLYIRAALGSIARIDGRSTMLDPLHRTDLTDWLTAPS